MKHLFHILRTLSPVKIGVISLMFGIFLGVFVFSPSTHQTDKSKKDIVLHKHHEKKIEEKWTCSMHPQIQKNKLGKCPICAMDLIPVPGVSTDDSNHAKYEMSESVRKLAEISTTKVERKAVEAEIRLNGTVNYDETKVAFVTARVGGRIDRMFVDYTGVNVKKGDHMVYLYSPELISAQEELIQAIKNQASKEIIDAAKERLRLWGLPMDKLHVWKSNTKQTIIQPLLHLQQGLLSRNMYLKVHILKQVRIFTPLRIFPSYGWRLRPMNQIFVGFVMGNM